MTVLLSELKSFPDMLFPYLYLYKGIGYVFKVKCYNIFKDSAYVLKYTYVQLYTSQNLYRSWNKISVIALSLLKLPVLRTLQLVNCE